MCRDTEAALRDPRLIPVLYVAMEFTKGSLLRKSACRSDQADIGAETRRRSLFLASQAIFRYYFLIRSNQDH
jgi:hypothetical protein